MEIIRSFSLILMVLWSYWSPFSCWCCCCCVCDVCLVGLERKRAHGVMILLPLLLEAYLNKLPSIMASKQFSCRIKISVNHVVVCDILPNTLCEVIYNVSTRAANTTNTKQLKNNVNDRTIHDLPFQLQKTIKETRLIP